MVQIFRQVRFVRKERPPARTVCSRGNSSFDGCLMTSTHPRHLLLLSARLLFTNLRLLIRICVCSFGLAFTAPYLDIRLCISERAVAIGLCCHEYASAVEILRLFSRVCIRSYHLRSALENLYLLL